MSNQCIFRIFQKNGNVFRSFGTLTKAHFDVDTGVKTIVLDDAKSRNSLSIGMMEELIEQISIHRNDNLLRTIVLTAKGPVFSAGHNFKELGDSPHKQEQIFDLAASLMREIIDSPVPVIARVDGVAAAAGCQLVAQCDLAYATQASRFSTPGVNFGIFCSTPGVALARTVNKRTALKMLFTGMSITAQEAESKGLINKSCATPQDLDEEVSKICAEIKSKSRQVIEIGKRFYYKQVHLEVKEAYKTGGKVMVDNLQTEDGKEGVASFLEKRKPTWTN